MKNETTVERITMTKKQRDKYEASRKAADARSAANAIAWQNADASTRKKILNYAHDAHIIATTPTTPTRAPGTHNPETKGTQK